MTLSNGEATSSSTENGASQLDGRRCNASHNLNLSVAGVSAPTSASAIVTNSSSGMESATVNNNDEISTTAAAAVEGANDNTSCTEPQQDGFKRKRAAVSRVGGSKRRKDNDAITNGRKDKKKKTAEEILRLEEEVFVLEATLEALAGRKQQVETEISLIREKLTAAKNRLNENEQQRANLEDALKKHTHLQQELQATLAKSLEGLSRLLRGSEDQQLMPDFVVGASLEQSTFSPETDEMEVDSTANLLSLEPTVPISERQEPSQQQPHQKSTTELNQSTATTAVEINQSTAKTAAELNHSELSQATAETDGIEKELILNNTLGRGKEMDFIRATKDGLSLMTFLHCLQTPDIIRKIMDIRALEALTWDQVQPFDGRYRFESLWNTCVDFCIMGHIRQPDRQENSTSAATSFTENDPDIAMCPHELVGECTDIVCLFKHTRKSPPNPDPVIEGNHHITIIRPSDKEDDRLALASTSSSATSVLDPNVALCPYELTGVCADPLCAYQHLNSRPKVPILPRELLPLPPLKIPPQVGLVLPEKAHEATHKWGKSKRPELANVKKIPASIGAAPKMSADPFFANDDFVKIPEVMILNYTEQLLETEEGLEDWHRRVQHATDAPRQFWWAGREEPSSLAVNVGMVECLKYIGGFDVVLRKKYWSLHYEGKRLSGPLEVIMFVGRVVDCTRLVMHAGRVDIAKSLVMQGVEVVRRMQRLEPSENCLLEPTATLLNDVLEVTKEAVDTGFAYNSHPQNPLIAAFENESLLAILSCLLQSFHNRLVDPKEATRSLIHHTCCTKLIGKIRGALRYQAEVGSTSDSTYEGKNTLLDRCLALFSPKPLSVSIKTAEVEEVRDGDFGDFRLLLATFLLSRSLYTVIAKSASFASHRQNILELFWKEAKVQLRSSGPKELQAAIAVGLVLFGCIGNIIRNLDDKQSLDPSTFASLTAFDKTLNHIVSSLRDDYLKFLFGDVLVTPLIAATTSFAVFLRNYPKAQHRIEESLATRSVVGQMKMPILAMSELLWSQLIILRSSLPFDPRDTNSCENGSVGPLSRSLSDNHEDLANTILSYGVHLNYVTLEGDWNLLPYNSRRNLKHARHAILPALLPPCPQTVAERETSKPCPFEKGFIENNRLNRLRTTFNRHPLCLSAFPQSTFLVGHLAKKLEVIRCFLPSLPLSFGYHFPNLIKLNLRTNALDVLPDSMACLVNLQVLNLEKNELKEIPEWVGTMTKLRILNVSINLLISLPSSVSKLTELIDLRIENNKLSVIPDGLLSCRKLRVLHIALNYLSGAVTPQFLMPYFPRLHDLKLEPQHHTESEPCLAPAIKVQQLSEEPASTEENDEAPTEKDVSTEENEESPAEKAASNEEKEESKPGDAKTKKKKKKRRRKRAAQL